jgi:hypothetical protein
MGREGRYLSMEFFEDRPERDLWSGFVSVDADGGIRLPWEVTRRYRPAPGSRIYVEAGDGGMLLHRPVAELARAYVEPANTCNLSCRTCVRRVWEEPLGHMEMGTFEKVLRGVGETDPRRCSAYDVLPGVQVHAHHGEAVRVITGELPFL